MSRSAWWTRLLSDLIPVAGVLFLSWDALATLFILSCEVIALSIALGWLFDYPRRSRTKGVFMALLFTPAGLLMWLVLAELRGVRPRSVAGTVVELLPATWIALAGLSLHAVLATRDSMALARIRGASIQANDRILKRLLLEAFGPFVVFAVVAAADRSMGPAALAAILLARTAGDLAVARWSDPHPPRGTAADFASGGPTP